ncbi:MULTISPECIES: hypothetical protein [unclassified Rhodococcus (in: high G+C Gram-positive bacteria)]|uniref:Ppx/GppA phosphatase family protein n=1 Tax=unclassified Rhodococcus (in: high G+C Gram-positive bacteria) TaxID=192944 RepID=UPI00277B5674|nr:hypothetical protein [Rhodococcus sp. 1163]
MRLGVLDVESNTTHPSVMDAIVGGRPDPELAANERFDVLRSGLESELPTYLPTVGNPDRTVGTSRTIRSLVRRSGADRAGWGCVGDDRSPQSVSGALVAEASMRALSIDPIEIRSRALREGLIVRKLDTETTGDPVVSST